MTTHRRGMLDGPQLVCSLKAWENVGRCRSYLCPEPSILSEANPLRFNIAAALLPEHEASGSSHGADRDVLLRAKPSHRCNPRTLPTERKREAYCGRNFDCKTGASF